MRRACADERKQLRPNLLDGVLNKHELGMLIEFLRAKQETLDPLDDVPDAASEPKQPIDRSN